MCVQNTSFSWAVLAPIFQYFFPKDASQPALPFLAWCMGKAPYFDNGEDLGKCARACSAALSVLNTVTDPCVLADSPRQPQAHVWHHGQTHKHTHLPALRQTFWHEYTYVHP